MAIAVEWMNPDQHIVLWSINGTWTWKEFDEARSTSISLIGSVVNSTAIIADLRQGSLLPEGILYGASKINHQKMPGNLKGTLFIGSHILMRTLIQVITQMFQQIGSDQDFFHVLDMDEALKIANKLVQNT